MEFNSGFKGLIFFEHLASDRQKAEKMDRKDNVKEKSLLIITQWNLQFLFYLPRSFITGGEERHKKNHCFIIIHSFHS